MDDITLDAIRDGARVEVDQWQLERLALVGLKHELFFYTPGVTAAELGGLAASSFNDLDEAKVGIARCCWGRFLYR